MGLPKRSSFCAERDTQLLPLTAVCSALPDAVAIIDPSGIIGLANPAFCALTGYSSADLIGRRFADFDNLIEITAMLDDACPQGGDDKQFTSLIERREIVCTGLAESVVHLEGSVSAIDDNDLRYIVISLRDISKRKSAEAEMSEARLAAERANTAKSDLVAMVAHEIRTSANGVDGLLSLIEREPDKTKRFSYLRSAQRCAGSLLSIVGDILDLSKLEAGEFAIEPRTVKLNDLLTTIDAFWRPQIEAKGLRFVIDRSASSADFIHADDLRLCQILHNYISNALKHTEHGEIRLSVADGDAGTRRFAVSDTGSGIHESERKRLFRPFEQCSSELATRLKGTGLGLAITRRLAEQMQGQAGASSELGTGSTFWVEAVLPDAQPCLDHVPARPFATTSARPRILIADDDAVNRLLLAAQLEPQGYDVTFATLGEEAIAAIRTERFDAIVLDFFLGDIQGDHVANAIRDDESYLPATPIIALTASRASEIDPDAVLAFDILLEKGADPSELVNRLDLAAAYTRARNELDLGIINGTALGHLPSHARDALLNIEIENQLSAIENSPSPAALMSSCRALADIAANFGADRLSACARLLHCCAEEGFTGLFVSQHLAEALRLTIAELRQRPSQQPTAGR